MFAEPKPTETPETNVDTDPTPLTDYTPAALRPRRDGWTAERQRAFLAALAETGCVSEACTSAGVSSRSAYRLRQHAQGTAFAAAWDEALRLATPRLLSVAFDRAIKGGVRELWRDDQLTAVTRAPSDKMLGFLIDRLILRAGPEIASATIPDPDPDAPHETFPQRLAKLVDAPCDMVPIAHRDYFAERPPTVFEDL